MTGNGGIMPGKPRDELDEAWAMPENRGPHSLDAHVRRLLRQYGLDLTSYSPRDSRRGRGRGYPDWTIAGRHAILFRELKAMNGKLSESQANFAWAILMAGGDYASWTPADLASGRIEREIKAIS